MRDDLIPFETLDRNNKWFDQDNPLVAVLSAALKYKARGVRRFFVLLPGYRVNQPIADVARRIPFGQSAVFKVEPNQDLERQTLFYEHFMYHGGLYLLDVEDFLERQANIEVLGQTCHTVDVVLTYRKLALDAVVMATDEEHTSPELVRAGAIRENALAYAGSSFDYSLAPPHVKSIAQHHEYLFARYRSDLMVFDADFLPTAEPNVFKKACSLVIDRTNNAYVHLFQARNPVNGLVYGHGAPKIFPRKAQLLRRTSNLHSDFTLGVGAGLVIHKVCLGDHFFNWSEYSAWRTAAKECAKLTLAANKQDDEALHRLQVWCSPGDTTAPFHDACLSGARFGSRNPHQVLSSDDLKALFSTSV